MEELIKKQKEEYKKEFMHMQTEDYIYNWHINSIKEILEAEVERLIGVVDDRSVQGMASNYTKALEDQADHLTNIISNLK